jgi:ketosteroid isomerase-like protein
MSQDNVDRFVAGIETFNRGDRPGIFRHWAPEVKFEHRLAGLQGNLAGLDAVRGWFADASELFETWQIHCQDVRDLGDRVLALGTVRAIGKESGVETEMPFTVVARFKEGLVTHFIDYGDKDQALKAVGLTE